MRSTCIWTWKKVQDVAFKALKEAQGSSQTMVYYSKEADCIIVDASPVGLGAILAQEQADGAYKPVYYGSRALPFSSASSMMC